MNHKATGKKVTSIKKGTLGMVHTGKGILGGGHCEKILHLVLKRHSHFLMQFFFSSLALHLNKGHFLHISVTK